MVALNDSRWLQELAWRRYFEECFWAFFEDAKKVSGVQWCLDILWTRHLKHCLEYLLWVLQKSDGLWFGLWSRFEMTWGWANTIIIFTVSCSIKIKLPLQFNCSARITIQMCRALQITGVPILWWRILCGPAHIHQQWPSKGGRMARTLLKIHNKYTATNIHGAEVLAITTKWPSRDAGKEFRGSEGFVDSLRSVAGFHSAFCEQLNSSVLHTLISHTQSPASYLPDLHCIQWIPWPNQAKFVLMSYDDNINVYGAELDLKPSCPSFICSLQQ